MQTHVSRHTGNQYNASSALGDHMSGSFTRSEESTVNVDVVETLYPVEGVTVESNSKVSIISPTYTGVTLVVKTQSTASHEA